MLTITLSHAGVQTQMPAGSRMGQESPAGTTKWIMAPPWKDLGLQLVMMFPPLEKGEDGNSPPPAPC